MPDLQTVLGSKSPIPQPTLQAYKRTGQLLFITCLTQIGLMFSVAVPPAMTLVSGRPITLTTLPYDPYDIFRGEYVALRYDIATVPTAEKFERGQIVFVALHQGKDQSWSARIACNQKAALALRPGEVAIKGRALNQNQRVKAFINNKSIYQLDPVQVNYGIEQLFIKERSGTALEQSGKLTVVASVGADGGAVIKKVSSKQRTIYDAWQKIFNH